MSILLPIETRSCIKIFHINFFVAVIIPWKCKSTSVSVRIRSLYYKIMPIIHIKTKEPVKALYSACEQSWATIEYFQT